MEKIKILAVVAVALLAFLLFQYFATKHTATILGVVDMVELNKDGEDKYLYLKFDLSQIPDGAKIKSAILRMRTLRDENDEVIRVCRVLSQNWTKMWTVSEIWSLPVTDTLDYAGKWPKGTDRDFIIVTVQVSAEVKEGHQYLTLRLSSRANGDRVPSSKEYGSSYEIGNAIYQQVWYSQSITTDQSNWPKIEVVYTMGL